MAVIVNKSEAGKHPYRAFKVIPDVGSSFEVPSEEELKECFDQHFQRMEARNRAMIPKEIRERMRLTRARAKDVCSRPNTQPACQPPAS